MEGLFDYDGPSSGGGSYDYDARDDQSSSKEQSVLSNALRLNTQDKHASFTKAQGWNDLSSEAKSGVAADIITIFLGRNDYETVRSVLTDELLRNDLGGEFTHLFTRNIDDQGRNLLEHLVEKRLKSLAGFVVSDMNPADLQKPNARGLTPLMLASKHGMVLVVDAILPHLSLSDINSTCKGQSALDMAREAGRKDVEILIKSYVKVHFGPASLMDVVEDRLKNAAKEEHKEKSYASPRHAIGWQDEYKLSKTLEYFKEAVLSDDHVQIKGILSDQKLKNELGESWPEIFTVALNSAGDNALLVLQEVNSACAPLVLQAMSQDQLGYQNNNGHTALTNAAIYMRTEQVIELAARMTTEQIALKFDYQGGAKHNTALMEAARNDDIKALETLLPLMRREDIAWKNSLGQSAIDHAAFHKHKRIINKIETRLAELYDPVADTLARIEEKLMPPSQLPAKNEGAKPIEANKIAGYSKTDTERLTQVINRIIESGTSADAGELTMKLTSGVVSFAVGIEKRNHEGIALMDSARDAMSDLNAKLSAIHKRVKEAESKPEKLLPPSGVMAPVVKKLREWDWMDDPRKVFESDIGGIQSLLDSAGDASLNNTQAWEQFKADFPALRAHLEEVSAIFRSAAHQAETELKAAPDLWQKERLELIELEFNHAAAAMEGHIAMLRLTDHMAQGNLRSEVMLRGKLTQSGVALNALATQKVHLGAQLKSTITVADHAIASFTAAVQERAKLIDEEQARTEQAKALLTSGQTDQAMALLTGRSEADTLQVLLEAARDKDWDADDMPEEQKVPAKPQRPKPPRAQIVRQGATFFGGGPLIYDKPDDPSDINPNDCMP